jgi:pilus assembly protein CpaD
MTRTTPVDLARAFRLGGTLLGLSLALGACTHSSEEFTASIPNDYRLRHPIAIQDANRTVLVFVGNARGGLTAGQRSDVTALGATWLREGTGAIVADVPVQTPNARAAADSLREIQALLAATGVPPAGFTVRNYHPTDPRQYAAIHLTYPRLTATAGPCGLWPDDLGPTIKNKSYFDNKPYWNLGCASQHNIAVMADNPADLVQPRPESHAYTARRTTVFGKYRDGTPTATKYDDGDKAKISETGK